VLCAKRRHKRCGAALGRVQAGKPGATVAIRNSGSTAWQLRAQRVICRARRVLHAPPVAAARRALFAAPARDEAEAVERPGARAFGSAKKSLM
jgi:hypothetical protein